MSVRRDRSLPKQEAPKDEKIVFSFELLEFNEYFNIDCTCSNWSFDLMNMLRSISAVSRKMFKTDASFRNGTYRIHDLRNAVLPTAFPVSMSLKEVEQIRLGGSKGGIHGFLVDNVFYVVWLDPLHNAYPNERYGGLKKIQPPTTCCGWRDEELISLEEENRVYRDMFDGV